MQVKPLTDLTNGYYLKKIIKRKVPLCIVMVFALKDAYKVEKHFFYILVCVKWCETGWYYLSCSI